MGFKNTLFFKKSGCRAKYEPQKPEKETTLAQAVSNFLFFDDLKTVASQESEATADTVTSEEQAEEQQETKSNSNDNVNTDSHKMEEETTKDVQKEKKVKKEEEKNDTALVGDIEKTLFFTDVGCKAKYKPQKPKKPTSMVEAIGNIGADIHNMLFFDDLKTLNSQNASVASASYKSNEGDEEKSDATNSYEAFMAYEDIDEMTMPFPDEDAIQVKSRKLTIPPPAMKRFKKIDYKRHMSQKKKVDLLVHGY